MSREGLKKVVLAEDIRRYLAGKDPQPVEMATAPTLDMWSVGVTRDKAGKRTMTLTGVIRGHRNAPDGDRVESSPLIWLDRKAAWARTRNTIYVLLDAEIPADGILA